MNCLSYRFSFLCLLCLPVAAGFCRIGNDCFAQETAETATHQSVDTAAQWKSLKLVELNRRLAQSPIQNSAHFELAARKRWLENWSKGTMTAKPTTGSGLLPVRVEPILDAVGDAREFRKQWLAGDIDRHKNGVLLLENALKTHPNDSGIAQLVLQWYDDPSHRKQNLDRVEKAAIHLIRLLKKSNSPTAESDLAIEFTLYRRARALAYRELPAVLEHRPIEDPDTLDRQIQTAFEDLIASAGKGRPEFVLLEIRMLRRAKRFGSALQRLEKYGAAIELQWYQKKRRDLLRELMWEWPCREATRIYSESFPDEVAKEAASEKKKR